MPDLINLYEIAQASGHQSIYAVPDRCVPIQHRRSSCKRCLEVCPAEAIVLEGRSLKVNNALCVSCGSCATVCPTEALISLDPVEAAFRRQLAEVADCNDGVACVACARVVAREDVMERHYVEVPCLSRVNESVLLEAVAAEATGILLVDGGCRNCKYRMCDAVTKDVVETANYLLEKQGSPVRVERRREFPAAFERKPQERLGASRRAAFEDAGASTKGILGRAAKIMIKQEKDQSKASAFVINMLGLDKDDPEPMAPRRQERLLDALFAIGEANGVECVLPDMEGYLPVGANGAAGADGVAGADGAPDAADAADAGNAPDSDGTDGVVGADGAPGAADAADAGNAPGSDGMASADGAPDAADAAGADDASGAADEPLVDATATSVGGGFYEDLLAGDDAEDGAEGVSEAAKGDDEAAANPAEADEPEMPSLDSRFFGMVHLDRQKCNKCGICCVVCKQHALVRCEACEKLPDGTTAFMEFTPALCVQCNLCNEACFRKAITVDSRTPLAYLFSFDPVVINV